MKTESYYRKPASKYLRRARNRFNHVITDVSLDDFLVALAKLKVSLRRKSGLFAAIVAVILTGCTPAIAMPLLDAIAMVESSNNPNAIGDGGKATGAWQMHKAARSDARRYLGRDGTDRELAGALLKNINLRLHRELKRSPAPSDSYAAWNLGLSGYRSRGFLLSNCPKITQRAAARVERLTW